MARFVRYERYGEPDVLEIVEVEPGHPGEGQVRVRVQAAGLNPVDYLIIAGGPAAQAYGGDLPSGVGNDFSGEIDEIGPGVEGWQVGDKVLGGARNQAMADFVVTDAASLVRKPDALDFERAGAITITGRTASASVAALDLGPGDTVLVSSAAGGVGVLAAQLALRTGATVIGTASEHNHEFLRSLGVIPVAYGPSLAEAVRAAAPEGITAVLDNHGAETISVARELGVPDDRINTIAAHGIEGVKTVGGASATNDDLERVATLLADGEIELPIDSIYPLERVAEAYEKLQTRHVRGKIVVVTE